MKRQIPLLACALALSFPFRVEADPAEAPPSPPNAPPEAAQASPPETKPSRPRPERAERPERPARSHDGPRPPRRGGPTRDTHPRPWIGILASPLDRSLREHLEIPDGFGIQIRTVAPESPAEKAGLQPGDLVLQFEDQKLISPQHLSLLVQTRAAGDRISLGLIRKGREERIEVVLDESTERAPLIQPDWREQRFPAPYPAPPRGRSSGPPQPPHRPSPPPRPRAEQRDAPRLEREQASPKPPTPRREGRRRPQGRLPGLKVNPGFPLRIIGTENHLKIENEQGSLTLSKEGEEHRLVLEDAEGRVVFEGSFQPEGGLKSLPEKARRQLETMKLDQLEFPRSAEPEGDESQGTPEAPTPPPHRPGEDDEGIL